jgi:thioredoxin 1
MLQLILAVGIGAGIGAALGHLGKCTSGTCPLTANWRRGALFGALLGVVLYSASSRQGSSAAMNESTAHITRIGEARFEADVVEASKPVVVDFYATWCGPCKLLAPKMEAMAGQFTNRVKFVKINVDESPALARRFEVEAIPTVLFFRNGQVVDRFVGLISDNDLKARLDSLAKAGTGSSPG